MKTRKMTVVACVALCGGWWMASQARAQGVGNPGSLPSTIYLDPSGTGWNVGPVTVVRDPNGQPWHKHFTDPLGGPIVAPWGSVWPVQETLIIGPNLPWSDWHEEIITPGWSWDVQVSILVNNSVPPAGLSVVNTPGTSTTGGILDFYFNSLPVGTMLTIRKQFVFDGIPGAVFTGSIDVDEYPTPEPASLGLLALGGVLALRRRRE